MTFDPIDAAVSAEASSYGDDVSAAEREADCKARLLLDTDFLAEAFGDMSGHVALADAVIAAYRDGDHAHIGRLIARQFDLHAENRIELDILDEIERAEREHPGIEA